MSGPASVEAIPSELVAGKYRLERLIGRGGMGSVWEGKHTSLGTHVAVKFIEAEYVDSNEARHRFENEARAAAMLRSKHVVQVYDHGVMTDGRPYIVMEYLRGEPLDHRLDQAGKLTVVETVRIMSQVCRALAKAHEAGIVHRDLKPENVFLVYDEEDGEYIAKVVDFGIAKFTDAQMGISSSTRTGSVLGTPYYMSPEQARGLRSVDYRSDLWSVGVITYRCLIGSLPFEGEAIGDLLVKICTAPLPVPSQNAAGVPSNFDLWFQRALGREPHQRFQSAAELAEGLAHALGVPIKSMGPGSAYEQSVARAVPGVMPGPPPMGHGAGTPAAGYGTQPSPGMATPMAASPAAHTGAPFTQTRSLTAKSPKGGIIAALSVGALVLIGGAALAFKVLGSSAPAPETEASVAAAKAQPPAAPVAIPSPAPSPVAAPSAEKPAVAPTTEDKKEPPPPPKPPAAKPASKRPRAAPKSSDSQKTPKPIDIGY
jgi:serine/threonine-protein kinase